MPAGGAADTLVAPLDDDEDDLALVPDEDEESDDEVVMLEDASGDRPAPVVDAGLEPVVDSGFEPIGDMQPIDILGDDVGQLAGLMELGEHPVACVGLARPDLLLHRELPPPRLPPRLF